MPAAEVRGEGIFFQFAEAEVAAWSAGAEARDREFIQAHHQWRTARRLPGPYAGYPGIRYLLLHSFSHALMRQL